MVVMRCTDANTNANGVFALHMSVPGMMGVLQQWKFATTDCLWIVPGTLDLDVD